MLEQKFLTRKGAIEKEGRKRIVIHENTTETTTTLDESIFVEEDENMHMLEIQI